MIEFRKLAAIDIAFLGYKLVLAEYLCGVFLSGALGLFVLYRGHSFWQVCLGIYLICLGINYVPLLAHTLSIGNREAAGSELGAALNDARTAMAKYRRQSLFLLVPVFPVLFALASRASSTTGHP